MPGGDGTGPNGFGSMTGRGLGLCAGYNNPGFTKGRGTRRGFGRGFGRGRGRRIMPVYNQSIGQEAYTPEDEIKCLKKEKENIEKRIGELEKILE